MNFLDLVRPSEKDLGSGQRNARRYLERISNSLAAANVGANSSICPSDTVRVIHTISFNAGPGAGQSFNYAQSNLVDPSVFVQGAIQYQAGFVPAAAQIIIGTVSGLELVVMQGEFVNSQANFSAGGVANNFTVDLMGWEFPRGSIQR